MIHAEEFFERLETSIQNRHIALSLDKNPALLRLRQGKLEIGAASWVIAQYCFLPSTIVEFLSWGIRRSRDLNAIREELERNRGEELGSRTQGIPHYRILENALNIELGLDVLRIPPHDATLEFLRDMRDGLTRYSPSHAIGVVYALEDSAVPELSIVAEALNELAILKGLHPPIHMPSLSDSVRKAEAGQPRSYCLEQFFALHLLDFEIGHRSRLAGALGQYLEESLPKEDFERGFEQTLDNMDMWWSRLADH